MTLEVRGLRVAYGPVLAVSTVDLDVGADESVVLLGANGAGKSSTLRAISGLASFDGTIHFDGHDLRTKTPEEIARFGLIHVPEGRRVFVDLTVHENLCVGLLARAGRTEGYSIDDVYDLFPQLRSISKRAGWALSGGEQQMVAIGRALVGAPRMLLLDEPSLGLAPVVTSAVFAALDEIRKHTPLLVIEQQTTIALRHSDRGYVIASGRVVLHGTSAELSSRADLLDKVLGQSDVHEAVG